VCSSGSAVFDVVHNSGWCDFSGMSGSLCCLVDLGGSTGGVGPVLVVHFVGGRAILDLGGAAVLVVGALWAWRCLVFVLDVGGGVMRVVRG
jgi:hypothetical protein